MPVTILILCALLPDFAERSLTKVSLPPPCPPRIDASCRVRNKLKRRLIPDLDCQSVFLEVVFGIVYAHPLL